MWRTTLQSLVTDYIVRNGRNDSLSNPVISVSIGEALGHLQNFPLATGSRLKCHIQRPWKSGQVKGDVGANNAEGVGYREGSKGQLALVITESHHKEKRLRDDNVTW